MVFQEARYGFIERWEGVSNTERIAIRIGRLRRSGVCGWNREIAIRIGRLRLEARYGLPRGALWFHKEVGGCVQHGEDSNMVSGTQTRAPR